VSNTNIKLASRTSALALFQTEAVKEALSSIGIHSSIVPVQTKGDKDQHTALQHLGQTGIFTKAIDDAVLNGSADVGVHSLKDYPTAIPKGLALLAVLPRDGYYDAFIPGSQSTDEGTLLSGSPRRKAQWLRKYPNHKFSDLRGNMDTRLAKIRRSAGGIVSAPGLERLGLLPEDADVLEWMVPAPAAGVMAVIGRDTPELRAQFSQINHLPTYRQATVERDFMAKVEGGCASPLGALCTGDGTHWHFTGTLLSLDGKTEIRIEETFQAKDWATAGEHFATQILQRGGASLMAQIKAAQPMDVLCLKEIGPEERKQALELGVKLHDVDVLRLEPHPFRVGQSEFFIVASAFGADRLVPVLDQLPSVGITIGNKAALRLKNAGFKGTLHVVHTSDEAVSFIQNNKLRNAIYYGALNSSKDWEALGIKHTITYTNAPSQPRLARQQWDAIAAFSPLGVASATAHNSFPKNTPVVAIGPATLKACRDHGYHKAITSEQPTLESVIHALKALKND